MGRPITNITIVGGGTSGWIAAAYLNHRLQWGPMASRDVNITVIESPQVGIIGVGEATVPTLKATLKLLRISEAEFMKRTDATFKLGIWFDGWNLDDQGQPIGFMHPFTGGRTIAGLNPGYAYKQHGIPWRKGVTDQDFVRMISLSREAFERSQGPRALNGPQYGGALQYAYHVNAGKLADFLAEVCKSRGVKHVRDNVLDVKLDKRGYISSLQLEKHGKWPVELVIDCTGFRGLLINKALGEPFLSYSDYLLNDSAIPLPIPHPDSQRIPSATAATAMDAGWAWNIPLSTRVGTGYVFCSQFKSDDDALRELRQLNGPSSEKIEPPQSTIKMRVGRNQRSWVKNCVAIGLSSGFVEPLESTAIMTVELQSRWLLSFLPTTDFEEPLANQYNQAVARTYDEIRDFLGLHFSLSERKGKYWDAVRNEAKKSDALEHHLELWKYSLPSPADPRNRTVYSHWSVLCVLMGKNFYKDCKLSLAEAVPLQIWQRYGAELRAWKGPIVARLAPHKQLVDHVYAHAVPGASLRKRDFAQEKLLSSAETFAAPQPIMAPPQQTRAPQVRHPISEART